MKIVFVLLVLSLLALGLDRGAELVAERVAAQQARERLGLAGDVDVEVGGFPFLTQLVAGQFEQVHVETEQAPLGPLTAARLGVTASGVAVDYQHPTATRADRAQVQVLIPYEQVGHVAPEGVRVAEAGPRSVRVTAPLGLPGREVTSRSRVQVVDGAVLVRAQRIRVNGTPLADTGLSSRVQGRLDFSIPLDGLPPGFEVVDVVAGPDGVLALGEARGVALARFAHIGP